MENDDINLTDPEEEAPEISAPCPRRDERVGDVTRGKMHCFNWLGDIPGGYADSEMVEVQFKNTRKGYYKNSTHLPLAIGDMVAVEASPGHDIGKVSMVGALVDLQMRKANIKPGTEHKRVFRKAKPADLEKYREACARETDTMIRARKIAESLNLNMKIGDVEYQGDGNKAIFYYIADERVDFRQLIKVLAETFKIRIEMKQIGARQEAGRIGGIGPCGRPLCCSSWMSSFVTVATSAARFQDISLNPQKLAGQCAKLKCCLNFEVDAYVESAKKMPPKDVTLETADATYFTFKTDIFKREITYSTDKNAAVNLVTISADRAFEIIALNKEGQKPLSLKADPEEENKDRRGAHDILEGDLTRFDKKKRKKKKPAAKADGQAPDKQPKEKQPKDQQPKEKQPKDQQPKDQQSKEKQPKDQQSRDQQPKEQQPKEPRADKQRRQPRPEGQPQSEGQPQPPKQRPPKKKKPKNQNNNANTNDSPGPNNEAKQQKQQGGDQ